MPSEYYIRELLAPHAVNTAPLATIESYLENPEKVPKLPTHFNEIDAYFELIESKGIDMDDVYNQLITEGLEAFEQAFEEMLETIK